MPKSKSKVIARAARGPRRARSTPLPLDDTSRFFCGMLDAFRLPDSSTAATALVPMREDQPITGNSGGDAAVAWAPGVNGANFYGNVVTSGNLASTWTASTHPQYTAVSANLTKARMTGWRFVVTYTGAEQTASGTMYVGSCVSFATTMISSPMVNYTMNMRQYPLRAGMTYTFYGPQSQNPDFQTFSGGTWQQDFFPGMVFFFRGMPVSTQCINIRVTRSVEYLPELSASALVSAVPEPYDPVGLNEAGILSGTAQDSNDDDGPSWTAAVGRAVYTMVRGVARGAVDNAREDLRGMMGERRIDMIMN